MYRFAVAVALVAASTVGVTVAAAPAAAQSNETVLGDVFDSDDPADDLGTLLEAGWAFRKRALFGIQQQLPGFVTDAIPELAPEQHTAADELGDVAEYYNDHNATLESYVNDRATVSKNRTVKLTLHLRDETSTRYLEVNASNGSVTSSEIVSSTNRTVTDTVDVCGYAADQSREELERFTETYAEPNEDVTRDYLARLAGKYGADVETTLIDSSGECGGSS